MVTLPCGNQCAIHGPAVNLPTDLTVVCTLLPRLPSQTLMVSLKLEEAMYIHTLQGTLHVPVYSTSKSTDSSTVAKFKQPIVFIGM